mmetsp:Transcript_44427/g.43093  ORF Transcript_44427/g.43093 Transcript_44427/m.43093 type:complete len:281 (+) Transcript_44427:1959-2801(+)
MVSLHQSLRKDILVLELVVHVVGVHDDLAELREAHLQEGFVGFHVGLKHFLGNSFPSQLVYPLLSVSGDLKLLMIVNLSYECVDLLNILFLEEARGLGVDGNIGELVLPDEQVVGALAEAQLLIKQVYGRAPNQGSLKRLLHVINRYPNDGQRRKVAVLYRDHHFFFDGVGTVDPSVQLGLQRLPIQAHLNHHEVLKVEMERCFQILIVQLSHFLGTLPFQGVVNLLLLGRRSWQDLDLLWDFFLLNVMELAHIPESILINGEKNLLLVITFVQEPQHVV